jgi:hypothetical protein
VSFPLTIMNRSAVTSWAGALADGGVLYVVDSGAVKVRR